MVHSLRPGAIWESLDLKARSGMFSESLCGIGAGALLKAILVLIAAVSVTACGGSNSNASPGSVVVVEEVEVEPEPEPDPDPDPGPEGGEDVASVVPDRLNNVITDTGTAASAAFGSKTVYQIDVSQLTDGQLDPAGLVLGNDVVFEIAGGALRVTPPASGSCVLELAPGAVVFGADNEAFLVIEQGCQIDAEGTAIQPIVMTAAAEVVSDDVEEDERGLWGGLVINGFAPINDCPQGIEGGTAGCTKEGEANSGTFGGDDPNDNSGILKYVSVRYAGSNVDPENQLNGIAFQGVGDGTVVDYVQVHNNLDDGIEFFGGTVNAKHVVLTGNADDSLDWTDGWQGKIQYLYIEQGGSADNAIEADNREGNEGALPRSKPAIRNMTVLGNPSENALRLRRGTGLLLGNSYVANSATCMRVDGTSRGLLGTELTVEGSSFACAEMHSRDDDGSVKLYLDGALNVSQNGGSVEPVGPTDIFFDNTDFIGAFGSEDWSEGWTLAGSVSAPAQPDFGCPEGTTESPRTINDTRVCQLSGTVTQDLLLTSNNYYELVNKVTIGEDNIDSRTLTVQAGTKIFGSTPADFLVISRGSKIIANGTRTAPVELTAFAELEGTVNEVTDRGLWGGLVINGRAPINDCPAGIEGGDPDCTKEGEADSGTFGGNQPEDDSGVLRYVVVKYAGSAVNTENQLNGIAFQGVGSGTEVSYVQVHNNLDDGIEFFGGTVSAKYVVLTGNADDSLDWTDGWQGSIQYLVINQADDTGDSGIEADNREGNANALPRSLPRIANMTIKGNSGQTGIRLRRGTGLALFNTVVEDSNYCLRIQDESLNQLGTGVTFDGVSFDCATGAVQGDDVPAISAELDASNVSQTGAAVPAADLSADPFFDDVSFIGAVQDENNDWTQGWTVGTPNAVTDFPCPAGTDGSVPEIGGRETCQMTGTYSGDLVLTRDNYYVLNGKVVIGGDNTNPGTLTIGAGTFVIGDDTGDFLVVSRGSKILANGTRFSPITMTSQTDVEGTADQVADRGLWGGLVINGNAPINDCPVGEVGGTAGCTKEGEANSGTFGGDQPGDDSGVLNYLVVKFAGSQVDNENQLNGIAFQGVGSGTDVDYVQVHNNLDDGIEFFGGTVNASRVVLTGNADDSLDWTDGWTGTIQYLHMQQDLAGGGPGDNGIEADNREGDEDALPRSLPTIANMTLVGRGDQNGIRLRRGTGLNLYNSQVSGSNTCLRVSGASSLGRLGTDITFQGVTLDCADANGGDDEAAVQAFLDGSTNVNQDGSGADPVTLPAGLDADGSDFVGSGVDDWGVDWTVGVN